MEYTISAMVLSAGNTNLQWMHVGTDGDVTAVTVSASRTQYAVSITGDGGAVAYGLRDPNAAGFGQIEITDLMVIPGTHTAAECEALYQKTEAKQSLYDWSNSGNHAQRGSTTGSDTNDPSITPTCRNRLAAGSTEDLENAAWTAGAGATIDDATHFTPAQVNAGVYQSLSSLDGVEYTISAMVLSAGNTNLQWMHVGTDGDVTAVTVSASRTQYAVSITGDGGAVAYGLRDPNAAGFGQIEITEWQVEVADAATDYINPSTEALVQGWTFEVDDDTITDPLTLDSDWTFLAVLTPDDNTSVGLFRNGAASPNVSLDANGKVSYEGGGTVVSTNAVPIGKPSVIAITKSGTTITHYLNGVANGSGVSGATNAFAALRIGYDGTAYYDGEYEGFFAYNRALSPGTIKRIGRELARRWAYEQQNHREMDL